MIASATKRICPSDFSLTRTVYYINIIDDRCCSNTYSACFSPFIPASKHPSVTQKLFLAQTAKKTTTTVGNNLAARNSDIFPLGPWVKSQAGKETATAFEASIIHAFGGTQQLWFLARSFPWSLGAVANRCR